MEESESSRKSDQNNVPKSDDSEKASADETNPETNKKSTLPEPDIPGDKETSETEEREDEVRKENEAKLTEEEKNSRRQEAEELKVKGNEFFKIGEYKEAVDTYDEALNICPLIFNDDRAVLHSNLAACYQHLDEKDEAIENCTKALELKSDYLKARRRRAQLYRKTEHLDEALKDYSEILKENPADNEARAESAMLQIEINERNEKMKTEMLGKLKDLGNLFLRPFGLSTDNFKLNQDPNSGGYSVNFQQNAPSQ